MATYTDVPDIPNGHLLQVSSSRLSKDATSADIIAIHGLGTTSPRTWEARGDQACGTQRTQVNWLSDHDMLPNVVPSANIFTFTWNSNYYKNAPIVRIQDVAEVLLSKLQSQRDKENTHPRPLIFIASSFGGLIITKALEIANIKGSQYQKLVVATSGVIFLGSPLQGTRAGTAAQWRAMLAGILDETPSQTLLQDLDGGTKVLRDTSDRFVKVITARPMQTMTKCFWESKQSQVANAILPAWITTFWTITKIILVEEDSACLLGLPKQQLDASHVMMNKFRGPDDANFELVSSTIKNMVGEAKRIALAQREAVNIHNEYFMVSRQLNPLFTGRAKECKDLQQSLCPSHSTNPQTAQPRTYVIHGMGGSGKSEVALKFAYDNRAEFWGVFWIDARSRSSLNRGFVDIAKMCDLYDKSFEGAKLWLQNTPHSWLLILDNADDPKIDYAEYLPAASRGNVLVTSRVKECAILQTAGKDCYERLSEETAVELLLKACDIDPSLYDTHAAKALEIVDLLGHLALAIIQAGASIRQGICDLGDYKKEFEVQRGRLLGFCSNQAKSQYGGVYATFEVSATYLSGLRDCKNKIATDALELLNFYAFMSFTDFPEVAFEEAWRNSRKISRNELIDDLSPEHRSHLPLFMRQDSSEDLDTISLREAQSLLASLSIVILDLPAHKTRMHPVTHIWARYRLEKQKNCANTWLGALAVLCLSIRNPYQQEALWVQLQPHIELIKKSSPNADQSWTKSTYSEDIRHLYSMCLLNCGDVKEAIGLIEDVVKVREKLAEDHPDRLVSQHELARAYEANGQVDKAIKLLEHVVKVKKEKLNEDHPSQLVSQHVLARAYYMNGQVDKAVKLLEHVVKIQEKLPEDHPSQLASQHELAGAYQANGQVDKAVQLLEHVVKVEEKLPEDHPDQLASQHELARAYQANGQVDKAVKLLEHVVKVQEKLAEDHPSQLASQHALAVTYQANGQVDKAVKLLEHVVKVKEKLAEDHPDRLASQHALAVAYQANGQVGKAVKLLEHVVKVEEKLAEDHPDRFASQHALAVTYQANGQVNKAVKLLEHVVKVEEKLAEDHPDRLVSQHELARAYHMNGQVDKAVKLLEHVVKVEEKLAEDHPDRLVSQHELAVTYQANGQVDKAVKLLEHVVKIQEKLAEDHPNRLASQHTLARAYHGNEQVDKAIKLLEHVVKVKKEKLAEDHPSRLASQRALATVYRAIGQDGKMAYAVGMVSRPIPANESSTG
ncbi:hypothetical protein MMC12_001466 [Toensbergia leucococca]|nr:hypothetical protein [Toensbergia leucococca]